MKGVSTMSCARGNMNNNNNNSNNDNNDMNDNNNTDEYYGYYPLDYLNNGSKGGFKCYRHRTEQVFEFNCGTNIN